MKSVTSFTSWTQLPLVAGGRSLIEASAGTGKTWTISVLYLRLLLERKLPPRQIVVTTFTDAAAQELRERIRERILWAERLADVRVEASSPIEPDEAWLRARWTSSSADETTARADLHRLRLALAELDLAPIGTLHSLCRRILGDFPFECGAPFDLGELVDAGRLHDELLDDLWRRLGQSSLALSEDDLAAWNHGRAKLRDYLDKAMAPGVTIAAVPDDEMAALISRGNASRIRDWLGTAQFTRANSALRTRLVELADFIECDSVDETRASQLGDGLSKVLADPLEKHLKPGALARGDHAPILDLARDAARLLPLRAVAPFQRALIRYQGELREQARRRLAAAGQLTFDELIDRVHAALQIDGNKLAARLFEAWPVALVDEFQDTDAQQYGILDRIYRDAEGAPRGRLVMIGDPKQAIYRFRGGDIDAYLAARDSASERMALDTNFRSSRALVAALNEFYEHAGIVLSTNPDHRIIYEAVNSNGRDKEPYAIGGQPCEQALQIHFLNQADVPESQPLRKSAALDACANQIVELLSGGHTIGQRPLAPGDIAVLLPSHGDIADLRALLQAREVPCVSSSRDGVFASDWARELQIVLHAALHPRDDAAARAALATRLGGRSWDELRALAAQPDAWQRETALLRELDALWRTRGVLAVVRALIERASERLFARADRERALTDLRHLGELLQAQSDMLPGRDLLLAWLADQREGRGDGGDAAEDMQLRIESDAARVTLMTLHASKGLEFDVVMLPLMWANTGRAGEIAVLHDETSGERVIAFGDEARKRHAQEGQDERFRLLYVALTRARHACHVYALSPDRPKHKGAKSADSDPNRAPLDAMVERILRNGTTSAMPHVFWSDAPWSWQELHWTLRQNASALHRQVRGEPAGAVFEYRYSFSALSQEAYAAAQEDRAASDERTVVVPDADAAMAPPRESVIETEHAELAWLAPVAGPEFGNAVHAMFERRRIGQPMAAQQALIRRALRDERVRLRERSIDELVPHLAARLQRTLDTPLLPQCDPVLTLAALPAHAQRAEMEFDFVLDDVSLRELRRICDFVPGTSTHGLRGLMNGKIDLVFEHGGRFHVLDYKTNRLGDGRHLSAYMPENLDAVMTASHYRFQALLYTVAVDRYLRLRIPTYQRSEHLGEAIYLFVRATGIAVGAPQAGIWAHRFDEDLLEAVDRIFGGRGARTKEAA